LAKITSDGISTTFKDQLYSGFQSLYIQKFKQRYTEYSNFIKDTVKTALKNIVSSVTQTGDTTVPVVAASTGKIVNYVFTKPFKSGEYNEGIKALQSLLTTLKLYS